MITTEKKPNKIHYKYFNRLLIISIFKYSRFTENICNFVQNAKKLHHEQGRYKQIENSSCRTETYSKVVSRTNRLRPCHSL